MLSRICRWTLLGSVLLCAKASSGKPILEFGFNDSGTTTASTGSKTTVVNFLVPTEPLAATAMPADLHSAAGLGVAGDIAGHPKFGVDRSFDNTASFLTTGHSGGIAINTTDESVSTLTSWTVSGWYKTDLANEPLSGGGTVLFQSPVTFSMLPDGSPGISQAGFAVRAENPNGIRTSVNGVNTGTGSAGNTWTDTQKWVFFAVVYDGTQTVGNIHYYRGYRSATESGANPFKVTQVAFDTINQGTMMPAHGIAMGNRTEDMNRAFDGFLDNMRVFGAQGTGNGALTAGQLEALRAGDMTIGAAYTADFDDDGDVDGDDLLSWQRGLGTTSATLLDGDATHNGVVDADDLAVWQLQFGDVEPLSVASGNAIPEPGTFVLALSAVLAASGRLRRRVETRGK